MRIGKEDGTDSKEGLRLELAFWLLEYAFSVLLHREFGVLGLLWS